MHSNQPIGILDSGLGGLTVVKEIIKQLPNEQLIYVGDTARCPYGPRTAAEVQQFTFEIVDFLLGQDVKAIVIACNTATAHALTAVREYVDIPVIGVIRPGSIAAAEATETGVIGVIGTVGTIKSEAYQDALKAINADYRVVGLAAPTLVEIAEQEHLYSEKEKQQIVTSELAPLSEHQLDALILGCTHYPLLTKYIREAVGSDIKLISSAEETAKQLASILADLGMLNAESDNKNKGNNYYTTGDPALFKQIGEKWLGEELVVKHIQLDAIK
jgi:glutamate racemase